MSNENKQPPLGLMPEWRHKELRLQEIREAIQRYLDAREAIPISWIAEEYALRGWLENREEEKKSPNPESCINRDEKFEWTDELVKEFCYQNGTSYVGPDNDIVTHIEIGIEPFKKSKSFNVSQKYEKVKYDGKGFNKKWLCDEAGQWAEPTLDKQENIPEWAFCDSCFSNAICSFRGKCVAKAKEERSKEPKPPTYQTPPKEDKPVVYSESYVSNLREQIEGLELIRKANDHIKSEKYFTQQDLDKAIADTWEAARLVHPLVGTKFDTLEDYLKTKK